MANVWKKYGIQKETPINCEIVAERCESKSDSKYWMACKNFLEQMKDFDHAQINKKQVKWLLSIKNDLLSEGF